jgi:hypothetical protein
MSDSKVTDAGIIERFTTAVNALVREKKLYGEDLETLVEVKRILAERQQCAVVTDEMEKRAILAAEKWASDNGFIAYMAPTGYVRAALESAQLGVRVPEDPDGFDADMVRDEANNWTKRETGKQMLLNYAALLQAAPEVGS